MTHRTLADLGFVAEPGAKAWVRGPYRIRYERFEGMYVLTVNGTQVDISDSPWELAKLALADEEG